jgi:hypothetical protein
VSGAGHCADHAVIRAEQARQRAPLLARNPARGARDPYLMELAAVAPQHRPQTIRPEHSDPPFEI